LELLVLVPPELALELAQQLAEAEAAVELALLSCRILQTRESKSKGISPTTNRFSYSSLVHLLSRHTSLECLTKQFLLHKSEVDARLFNTATHGTSQMEELS
jgi:hypothetical protein